MTILICIPCLLTGGTEIQTLNLVETLIKSGHQVVTACYFEYSENMVERYCQAGSHVELFEQSGCRIRGWRGILFLYKNLRRCIKKYKPQIAHVQYMAPGAQPIFILKVLGVKHILATVHTDADIYKNLRLPRFVQEYCLKAFTCITLRAEENFFGSSKLYEKNTALHKRNHFTIHNSVPSHISIAEKMRALSVPSVIGVVSRMEHIKGMDLVVPAFSKVRKIIPDVQLLVVGDGSLLSQMKKQAHDLDVEHAIKWVGRQNQEKLQDWYDHIDIFWMPSRSEGFGLSALEAMARGCVVIASDVGGLPELVLNASNGKLVPSDSVEELCNASLELLSKPQLWQTMSEQARQGASRFSQKHYSTLITNLYGKLVSCTY